MAKNKKGFNIGKTTKIRYNSPSKSWSIKVPPTKRDGLNYCQQKIYPSPDNGTLANLARKIPNADVFAFYKSAYNRWMKALNRYPSYEGSSTVDNIPYKDFYFNSCKSVSGFWKVSYRDDGSRDFGIDVNTDGNNNGGSSGDLDLSSLLDGLNSTTRTCDGTPYIIKDGETIKLTGDTQIISHPKQVLCENGQCTEGLIYLSVEDPALLDGTNLGYIQYPISPASETNGQVYQSFGSNIFYQLDTELINPTVDCDTNCTVSTDYVLTKPYALIEYVGKQYLSNHPPVHFTVIEASGNTYKHTWQLPEGCGNATESFITTEPVENYTLVEGAESTPIPAIEATEYYSDKPNAKLTWSSGGNETNNTPISYDLQMRQLTIDGTNYQFSKELNNTTPYTQNTVSGGVRVDWGGGDVEVLTGDSWTSNYFYGKYANFTLRGVSTGSIWYRSLLIDTDESIATAFISTYFNYASDSNLNGRTFNIGWIGTTGKAAYSSFRRIKVWDLQALAIDSVAYTYDNPTYSLLTVDDFITTPSIQEPIPLTGISKITITTNTGATSARTQATAPTVTLLSSGYQVIANFSDSTTQEVYSSTTAPASITAIKNYLKISDSTGQIAEYTYTSEPTNFKVSYGTTGWTLNFKPQNITYQYPSTCKPFNIITNTKLGDAGGCCGQKSSNVAGRSGTFDTTGIHNPPTIDCRVDPYTQGNPPQVCYPVGSDYLGYSDLGGTVTTFYRFTTASEVTNVCTEQTYRIDIFDSTGLVRQDTVCGNPTDSVRITSADGVNFKLWVGVNGVLQPPITYVNYDPTSNPNLFQIVQLPYKEVKDGTGTKEYYPPEVEIQYQCTTRYAGGNGPFTIDYYYNQQLNKWVINILDADGNIVSTQYVDKEPVVNDASQQPNINTLNQDPYLTCTCPDHDRKIYYYDQSKQDTGFIRDWTGDNSAGAPNILGTKCCKHVFSVLNQLGVSEKYIPEDFPTDPVPEKYLVPGMIGDDAVKAMKPKDINRFK